MMTTTVDHIFGRQREDLDYLLRPGSYALVVEDDRVLTVEEGSGLFLPGGGHENDETPAEALHRELLEETGYAVERADKLCVADEYFLYRPNRGMQKRCHVYRAALGKRQRPPAQTDCDVQWLRPEEAVEALYHRAFRWVVRRHVGVESP